MEAGVAQATPRIASMAGGGDRRTVAAEVGETDIVEQNDQDIGAPFGRFGASGQ